MEYKFAKNELGNIINSANVLLGAVVAYEHSDKIRKSKKTEKQIKKKHCMLRALYATQIYGCAGFNYRDECLVCEFRR